MYDDDDKNGNDTPPGINEPITRLTRDQKAAAKYLGRAEARYLVDTYYQVQDYRIATNNQIRAALKAEEEEPTSMLNWTADTFHIMETQIKGALTKYAEAHRVGQWAMSQKGIGPVITAGLLSRLELRETVGAWWNFAGLNPTIKWGKRQKRPWNAELKRLCWLAGESFVKVSGYEDAFYGKLYRERKDQEVEKNEAGEFADQAAKALEEKNYKKTTEAYKAYEKGRLPNAHLHARAKRYAVKMFLSHLHHVWYELEKGSPPPVPYIIANDDAHVHFIAPPNWPME